MAFGGILKAMRKARAAVLAPPHQEPLLRKALADAGIDAIELEEDDDDGFFRAIALSDAIRNSDMVVAEISELNPNVMIELGMALQLRKATMLVFKSGTEGKFPSDLQGLSYSISVYKPEDLTPLSADLRSWAAGIMETRERRRIA
jgi:predicted nucleotide-binding protein